MSRTRNTSRSRSSDLSDPKPRLPNFPTEADVASTQETQRQARAEAAFAAFRRGMTRALRRELESAITEAVREYSPTDQENRFVLGGAVERIIAAGMRAAGVPVGNLGHAGLGADLSVYVEAVRDEVLSLKATFSRRPSQAFRLVNFLGSAQVREMHPTLFLIPGVGLVLAHEGHQRIADAITLTSDAMTLRCSAIIQHADECPELMIPLDVPENDGVVRKVASAEVARAILERPHYPLLGAAVAADDPETDRVKMVAEMAALYHDGQLTDSEFADVKRRLLGGDSR